jgi:hypothetical protein
MRLLIRVLSPLVDPAVLVCLRAVAAQNAQLRHERDMAVRKFARLERAGRHLAASNVASEQRLNHLEPTVVIPRVEGWS